MTRWLSSPVTSAGFDTAVCLIGGIVCAAIGTVNAISGYWWPAFLFALFAVSPLRMAWRFARRPDAEPGTASDL